MPRMAPAWFQRLSPVGQRSTGPGKLVAPCSGPATIPRLSAARTVTTGSIDRRTSGPVWLHLRWDRCGGAYNSHYGTDGGNGKRGPIVSVVPERVLVPSPRARKGKALKFEGETGKP